MIVLISHTEDAHAVEVLGRLQQSGADVVLFDSCRFPRDISLTVSQPTPEQWRAAMVLDGRRRDLSEARVVWWRRPLPFKLHDEVADNEDRTFAYGECHAALAGLWSCLDAVWINDPDRDLIAARKLFQLKVAAQLGMQTPRTCVTTDPEEATRFIAAEGARGTIYKSFSATEKAWRETRLLRPDEHAQLANVRFAPVIFQEYIAAVVDLRITVVGADIFAAEIHSQQTDYPYDFRMTMEAAEIRPHRLPESVEAQLRALMASFGLLYGAIDMRLTPDGDYVFLEINPAGQWLFIELRTSQPITEALCELMLNRDRVRQAA